MSGRTSDEFAKIGMSWRSRRSDTTGRLRDPTTIWVVRLGDDLYVRSVNGRIAT